MAAMSSEFAGRILKSPTVRGSGLATVGALLPEKFGVRAANVIRVEQQGIGEASLLCQAITDFSDGRPEDRCDDMDGLLLCQTGGPRLRFGKTLGIGGDPFNTTVVGSGDRLLDKRVR